MRARYERTVRQVEEPPKTEEKTEDKKRKVEDRSVSSRVTTSHKKSARLARLSSSKDELNPADQRTAGIAAKIREEGCRSG